ncbi:CBS domain-containing protein [Sphingomonas echinoides]|uniref:CBS domain-containing protein n=1 Tax=Sphingomonas echinoides TaxID=59803 RepID=A0ABU4PEI1_9SPHN|nr:CBS domain-containing protein [Sphingomonas echinoides]MDX5982633.1 CBS domain-containing protein [Sphingomonas echinoides]
MTIAAILGNKGREVISITAQHSVGDAVAVLATRRVGAVPVMEGNRVVGIFSERDVIHAIHAYGADAMARSVGDTMTAPPITVTPGEAVIGALSLMTRRRIRHLPVVEGDRVIGFVSIGDLVKYRIDRIEADAEAMRSYIQSA